MVCITKKIQYKKTFL